MTKSPASGGDARRGSPDPAAAMNRRSPPLSFDLWISCRLPILETCGRVKRRGRETRAERE